MLLDKLKNISLVLIMVVALLGGGTTGVLPLSSTASEPQAPEAQAQAPRSEASARRSHADPAIQGSWSLVRLVRDGKTIPVVDGSILLLVTHRYMIWKERDDDRAFTYKVMTNGNPKQIELTSLEPARNRGTTSHGVSEVSGDTLTIHESDAARPRELSAPGGTVCIYRRVGGVSPAGPPAASAAGAPRATPVQPAAEQPAANLNADWAYKLFEAAGPTNFDLGPVQRGSDYLYQFRLKNVLAAPVDIASVRISCGCARTTVYPKHLKPGEEGVVNVMIDTGRVSGRKTITAFVDMYSRYSASTAALRLSLDSCENVLAAKGERGSKPGESGGKPGESGDKPGPQEDDNAPGKGSSARIKQGTIRGVVVKVDETKQLVEIDIGADRGLQKEQTLMVYRLQPRPAYVGRLVIMHLEANRAIGRMRPTSSEAIRIGDTVAESLDSSAAR